jgi:hypothetical protein
MIWLFLFYQTRLASDATAQKVNSHQLRALAMAEMALPGEIFGLWWHQLAGLQRCRLGNE